MRPLLKPAVLTLAAFGLIAAPGVASAQYLQAPAPEATTPATATTLAPFPTVKTTTEAAPTAQVAPPPPHTEATPAPDVPAPTSVAPVLVEAKDKNGNVKQTVGSVVGGVVGGVAGAAVAGPVGKFAGGFVGKRLVQGIFGGDKVPQLEVAERTPGAEGAATPVSDRAADKPVAETISTADPSN